MPGITRVAQGTTASRRRAADQLRFPDSDGLRLAAFIANTRGRCHGGATGEFGASAPASGSLRGTHPHRQRHGLVTAVTARPTPERTSRHPDPTTRPPRKRLSQIDKSRKTGMSVLMLATRTPLLRSGRGTPCLSSASSVPSQRLSCWQAPCRSRSRVRHPPKISSTVVISVLSNRPRPSSTKFLAIPVALTPTTTV